MIIQPSLMVLVKPAGIGGSTMLSRLVQDGILDEGAIVCADALRKEYLGDEANQSRGEDIFRELFLRLRKRCEAGKSAVADITGLDARSRATLIAIAKDTNVPAVALLRRADFSFETLVGRNRSRARVVPDEDVPREGKPPMPSPLKRMYESHRSMTPAKLRMEGFEVFEWDDTVLPQFS